MDILSGVFAGREFSAVVQSSFGIYHINGTLGEIVLRGNLLQRLHRGKDALKIHGVLEFSTGITLSGVMLLTDDGVCFLSTERNVVIDGRKLLLNQKITLPWEVLFNDSEVAAEKIKATYVEKYKLA
jgi:hypothetical protein